MTAFNERLKALREDRDMTQENLARAAGVSTSTVSKLEQTDMDPSWSTVEKLAAALGVSVAAFASKGRNPGKTPGKSQDTASHGEGPPASEGKTKRQRSKGARGKGNA